MKGEGFGEGGARRSVARLRIYRLMLPTVYKGIDATPLVAAFTRGLTSNHLVNRSYNIVYKGITINHLVNGIHHFALPCRFIIYKVLQGEFEITL